MKIGVMSDIHDNAENLLKAVDLFNKEKVDLVICCGDWVSPFILKFVEGLKAPIKTIFGNNEGDKLRMIQRKAFWNLKIEYPEKNDHFLGLELEGRKIAVYHGQSPEISEALVLCGKYDAVFTGHNHTPQIKKGRKTLWVNPGTVSNIRESKIIKEPTVAIYETNDNQAKIFSI